MLDRKFTREQFNFAITKSTYSYLWRHPWLGWAGKASSDDPYLIGRPKKKFTA